MPRRRDPFADLPPDDLHLWDKVRRTITPLKGQKDRYVAPVKPVKKEVPMTTQTLLLDVAVKPKVIADLSWPQDDEARVSRPDQKRIKQGALRPTASLDLHGMTVARAEKQLTQFLVQAQRNGHAWVEIITGHGRFKQGGHGEREIGVLKRLLPEWLNAPTHRALIKRVIAAPQSRGGAVWVALQ